MRRRFFYFSFCLLSLFTIFYLIFTSEATAQGEFQTDYKVNYSVQTNGRTDVTQQINLKNNTANYYAEKFELKIGSTKVENVKAQDNVGPLETDVKFEDNLTTITAKFNQRVIGINKTLSWNLSYSSNELATKSGQIWEISIPKVAKSPDIANYETQVLVPVTLGPLAFALPSPKTNIRQGNNQIFTFDKDQLTTSGISMSFGQKQVFQFNLSYFLENKNLTSRTSEITLPPDNNYQKIVLEKIDPQPADISVDDDGNFIAKYRLSPNQQLNIEVTGYVEVFSKSFRNIDDKLSEEDRKKYTQPQMYWETDSAVIKDKAKELKTPKQIYDFVSNYLSYNQEKLDAPKIERLGALTVYNSPKEAICMEFTDLFIALARAAQIPSREVIGFAYSQNSRLRPLSFAAQGDLLHSWPAYWDENLGWVQVDPTWGSTSGGLDYFNKLDFNHVTLAQRGISSILPFPAGSYKKQEDSNKKDVTITFAENLPQITLTPQLSLTVPDKVLSGIPIKVGTQIRNIGTTSILGGQLTLESNYLTSDQPNTAKLGILPPFSHKDYVFDLKSKSAFTKTSDTLILTFGETQISKPITVVPVYYLFFSPTALAIVALSLVIVIAGLALYKKVHGKKLTIRPKLL